MLRLADCSNYLRNIAGVACNLQAEASCMDDDFGEGAKAAAPQPRRRQYRVKSDSS